MKNEEAMEFSEYLAIIIGLKEDDGGKLMQFQTQYAS